MTTFPNSPRLIKGGIVLIDPQSSAVLHVIALQNNPDALSRTLRRCIASSGTSAPCIPTFSRSSSLPDHEGATVE